MRALPTVDFSFLDKYSRRNDTKKNSTEYVSRQIESPNVHRFKEDGVKREVKLEKW